MRRALLRSLGTCTLSCAAVCLLLACSDDSTGPGSGDAPQDASGAGGAGGDGAGGASGAGGVGGTSAGIGGSSGAGTAATGGGVSGGSGSGGASGSAGAAGTAGSSGEGGASGSSGEGGASGSSGDGGTSGGSGDGGVASGSDSVWCEAIGWAARSGRTGGAFEVTAGGDAAPVTVTSFSELQTYATDGSPRVIYVDGTLGSGWSGTSGDRLEVKSNKTIIGLRPGTELRAPIHIKDASNIIVRNLVINGPGSNSDQAWDNLNIEGSAKNVWVDHCEFWDGQDGNADVVKGADNVTFTWNIFGYKEANSHNFSNLVASSDDEPASVGKLDITLMFNHFRGVAQRAPRCRYGYIHVVNNLFTSDGLPSDYGVSAGKDCKVLTENNHFIEIKSPIYTSHKSGSSANDVRGNLFESTSGNTTGYGTGFTPPYDYAALLVPAEQVKALVEANAGATLTGPPDCN